MKANKPIINNSVSLLTKHGKQDVIGPILSATFSTTIRHTDKFDTDSLGSFDHKILRTLNPIECALKKAYLSCELTDCQQGLGSEGSVNSMFGIGVIDEEFLAFVDRKKNIEIVAHAKKVLALGLIEAKTPEDLSVQLSDFTLQWDNKQKWLLQQGINGEKGLSSSELVSHIRSWPAIIEPDFRAMNCPARQEVIALATYDLVQRLTSYCPKCEMANFVSKTTPEGIDYLPCELCTMPTSKSLPPIRYCDQCGFIEANTLDIKTASAFYCSFCNP